MKTVHWLVVLAIVFALFFFSMPWKGEFSLNDDALYADSVRDYVLSGNFSRFNYTSLMAAQILPAAWLSPLLGLDYSGLRL
ncbi:MAG: hypothetical protein HY917_03405, partial [Candidatus Diapherotrites archaeon]|nr:hypothetical protein [Candidatus Diapherotrites archaeon]